MTDLLKQLENARPTDHVLAANLPHDARQRIWSEINAGVATPTRRRRVATWIAAAASLAAAVAMAPALLGSPGSIALAAVDPLTFPVTPTWLPDGLGKPKFTSDSSTHQWAVYGPPGTDDIILTTTNTWNEWEDTESLGSVDVAGHPARILRQNAGEATAVTIAWKQPDGDLLGVTGRGRLARPELVKRVADSLVDRPQPLNLFLTLAPIGWKVNSYESDVIVSYGERGELKVILNSSQAENPSDLDLEWKSVSVAGRAAKLGQRHSEWILVSTSADGQEFTLLAPDTLTKDQVIEIAENVHHG